MKLLSILHERLTFLSKLVIIAAVLTLLTVNPVLGNFIGTGHFPLRINAGSAPDTLDPQKASFVNAIGHVRLLYEGLTRLDSSLTTVPGAAQSWDFSDGGNTITFNLRPELKYSDGSLLNAKRFEYSILRALDPKVASEYGSILDDIIGAAAYRSADPNSSTSTLAALRAAVEVHALDGGNTPCISYSQVNCTKLRIKLNSAVVSFTTIMSLWVTYPAKEELINTGGISWWNNPSNQIGNGPFIASKLNFNSGSVFLPNTYYWRGRPGYPIEYFYITDGATALEQYQNGGLDIKQVTSTDSSALEANLALKAQLHNYAGSCTFGVQFNNALAPFNDPKIRAAFAYSIDRQAFVNEVLLGGGVPTLTWIPPGMPGYDTGETRWDFNVTQAQQALSDSTYHTAGNLPSITVGYYNTPRNTTVWQWLASKWEVILGVSINLVPSATPSQSQPMYLIGWCGDFPDPSNYLSVYWKSSSSFAQRIHYSNAAVDTLLNQADSNQDPTARLALYAQAQDLIVGDVPAIFMWDNKNSYLVRPAVTGEIGTPMDALWMGEMDPLSMFISSQDFYLPLIQR